MMATKTFTTENSAKFHALHMLGISEGYEKVTPTEKTTINKVEGDKYSVIDIQGLPVDFVIVKNGEGYNLWFLLENGSSFSA